MTDGSVIDEERTLITNDNYINLIHRVDNINKRVENLEDKSKYFLPEHIIFFEGQVFEGRVFIKETISKAESTVVLIDPYIDISTLDAFKSKKENVSIYIIGSNKSKITDIDINLFNEEYKGLIYISDERYHDRYMILDNTLFYSLGSSVNYLGKRFTQVTLIQDDDIKETLRRRLTNIQYFQNINQ